MCYTCKSPPQPVSFCMIARKRRNVKMEFYTCIAKYTFFGIRDEKLLATARKSWYHSMVCSGIEAVISGLTRNFLKSWLFAPLKKPVKSGFFSGSKIKYFVVLSVSSFQKFLEEIRNHIHGELSEWSKVQHSKCCVPKRNLGFESLTLRQKVQ